MESNNMHAYYRSEDQDSSVGIVTRYGLGGLGFESRWGGETIRTRQTGPRAYPASYIRSPVSFPGVKDRGVALATHTHSHLAPRLEKEYSYTSTPPLGLRGLL
jgi:hypothetical protein